MDNRLNRVLLIIVALLLGAPLLQPYFNRLLFAADTPRPVEARGDLSAFERSSIQVFETVAPSVLQVVAQATATDATGGIQTGTGFCMGRRWPYRDEQPRRRECGDVSGPARLGQGDSRNAHRQDA
jgi:hypothetical protein